MVPRTAEAGPPNEPTATGDGWVPVGSDSPEWTIWDAYLRARPAPLSKADGPANPPDRPRHHDDQTDHHAGPDYTAGDLGVRALDSVTVDPQVPNVDRQHYQRDLDLDRVARFEKEKRSKLAARWGLVARRPDGSLWIINGQHHTLAAVGRGIPELHYRVFNSTGAAQEARVYTAWEDWHDAHGHEEKL
jgi:hypothetical protein